MALSLGILELAFPTLPSGHSMYGSFSLNAASSALWQQKKFGSLSLRVRPSSRGGRVAVQDLSAENLSNRGERSEEASVDYAQVGHRGPALREAPQRSDAKFWRRFPVPTQGGPHDVTVPAEALRRGAVFKGIVSSIQPFGAFVTFGAYTDGLIHISNLSADYVKDVGDVLELEQEVLVRIMRVEEATGRISLALVGKDEIEQRKPYMPPRRKESAKEDRASRVSYSPSSRSRDSREGRERPRFQRSPSTAYEEQERVSRVPLASSRQREAARGGGSRFHQGSERRSPFLKEEERKIARNSFSSTGLVEAGEEDKKSGNSFSSPKQREAGEEDRRSRNSFSSPRQREAGDEDGMSRNQFASSRGGSAREEERLSRNSSSSSGPWEPREEDSMPWNPFASFRQGEDLDGDSMLRDLFAAPSQSQFREQDSPRVQSNDGKIVSGGGLTRVEREVDREQAKPKARLVHIGRDTNAQDKSSEEQINSSNRSMMRSWYECDCCW